MTRDKTGACPKSILSYGGWHVWNHISINKIHLKFCKKWEEIGINKCSHSNKYSFGGQISRSFFSVYLKRFSTDQSGGYPWSGPGSEMDKSSCTCTAAETPQFLSHTQAGGQKSVDEYTLCNECKTNIVLQISVHKLLPSNITSLKKIHLIPFSLLTWLRSVHFGPYKYKMRGKSIWNIWTRIKWEVNLSEIFGCG